MRAMQYLMPLAAVWLLGSAGCETTTREETEQPAMMSNQPSRPLDAPNINSDMERFNSNLGDTATGTGGGGASGR